MLKQIAPRTTRVAVLRDPGIRMGRNWPVPLTLARSLNVDVGPVDLGLGVGEANEIERGIADFAEMPNGGLIVLPSAFSIAHRRRRVPDICRGSPMCLSRWKARRYH